MVLKGEDNDRTHQEKDFAWIGFKVYKFRFREEFQDKIKAEEVLMGEPRS